jgi:membrane-associated phospholipid phosphatase
MNKNENNKNEPLLRYDLKNILNLIDVYTIGILSVYLLLSLIYFNVIVEAKSYIFINLFIIVSIITLATIVEKFDAGTLFRLVRYTYIIPLIFYIYTQTQVFIRIINPNDWDWLLIKWDYVIFGVNPTEALGRIANPWLTEYLQFSYMMFFIMPLLVGFELYIRHDSKHYVAFARTIAFGFFLSYLLYFFLPAVGPRFTLHNFGSLNSELPGIFFTNYMRELVNIGGGIRHSIPLPAIDVVNRDCMPSGHTMITIINIWLAYRYRSRYRWVIYIIGTSLIFATVYLRYHYVVDLMAGAFFAVLVIWLEPKIRNLFKKAGFHLA